MEGVRVILLTGGTGFVGNRLRDFLALRREDVGLLVRETHDPATISLHPNEDLVVGDICDLNSLMAATLDATLVVHLAAQLDSAAADIHSVNVRGAQNVATAARNANCRVIMLGSAVVARNRFRLAYPETKLTAERIFASTLSDFTCLRSTWIYGQRSPSFQKLLRSIRMSPILPVPRNAHGLMQPVYVDDVASALMSLIDRHDIHGTYSIGGPERLTFRQLVNRIISVDHLSRRIAAPIPLAAIKAIATLCRAARLPAPVSMDFVSDVIQDTTVDTDNLKASLPLNLTTLNDGLRLAIGQNAWL